MEATHTLLQLGGRRLLSDCDVVGSIGKGGSIAILLLIGFILGGASSWLFFWWRQRRAIRIELEYRNRYGDAVRQGLPDVNALVKAANMPTIPRGDSQLALQGCQLPKAASAMAEGPLAMGVVGTFKTDALGQAVPLKQQQHVNPVAGTSIRSSGGNPFAGEVPSFNVLRNEVCSLNNTPSPAGHNAAPAEGQQLSGLIGTGLFTPAADPDSPRITKPAAAATDAATAGAGFGWPGMEGPSVAAAAGEQVEEAVHPRTDSVVVKGVPPAASGAGAAALHGSSDYLAALNSTATNPFETPALRQEQAQAQAVAKAQPAAADAKAAQKQELLQQVQGEEYGDDELDPEWASLLADLDARLQAAGRPALSTRERAVAIRSLIVATASQSADAALAKAVHDVEVFRRAQSFRRAA